MHHVYPIPLDIMERDCPRSCFQLLECILHLGKQEYMSCSARADVRTQSLSSSQGHLLPGRALGWDEGWSSLFPAPELPSAGCPDVLLGENPSERNSSQHPAMREAGGRAVPQPRDPPAEFQARVLLAGTEALRCYTRCSATPRMLQDTPGMPLIPQAPPRAITQSIIADSCTGRGLEESSTETSAHNKKPAYLPRKTDPQGKHVLAGCLQFALTSWDKGKFESLGDEAGCLRYTAIRPRLAPQLGLGGITADSSGFVF